MSKEEFDEEHALNQVINNLLSDEDIQDEKVAVNFGDSGESYVSLDIIKHWEIMDKHIIGDTIFFNLGDNTVSMGVVDFKKIPVNGNKDDEED
jgi:hypothetical protein